MGIAIDYLAKWIATQARSNCPKVDAKGREQKSGGRNRSSASFLRQAVKICICQSVLKAIDMCSLHPIVLSEEFEATPRELYYILRYVQGVPGYHRHIAKKYFDAAKKVILGGGSTRKRSTMHVVLSDDILESENTFIIIFIFYVAKVTDSVSGGENPFNAELMERPHRGRLNYIWKSSTHGDASTPNETTNISQFQLC